MIPILALTALAQEATYTNPIWPKNFPDPFIARDGSTFYVCGTQNSKNGFQIMKSQDLVHWDPLPAIGKPEWSDGQYWAPEVYKWKGMWYLLFAAKDRISQKRDLAISVGDRPDGPFKFLSKLVLGTSENSGSDDNGAIDANLYVERGKPYLLYIRESKPRSVKMIALSPDLSKTIGEAQVLIGVDRQIEQGILDAPTLIKRKGTYFLFYSSGWFQSSKKDANYQVWAATSKSLWGPYTKPSEPVLKGIPDQIYSPGHQCLIELPSGEWWMGYHGWDASGEPHYGQNPNGRTLRIDRLEWTKDGPKCVGPTLTPQRLPKIH